MFGVCGPASHAFSLYMYVFVLVLILDAIVSSEVYVTFNIFYQHIDHVYWGVVDDHRLSSLSLDIHLQTHLLLSSDGSCSMCCNYGGVSVHDRYRNIIKPMQTPTFDCATIRKMATLCNYKMADVHVT